MWSAAKKVESNFAARQIFSKCAYVLHCTDWFLHFPVGYHTFGQSVPAFLACSICSCFFDHVYLSDPPPLLFIVDISISLWPGTPKPPPLMQNHRISNQVLVVLLIFFKLFMLCSASICYLSGFVILIRVFWLWWLRAFLSNTWIFFASTSSWQLAGVKPRFLLTSIL